MKSLIKTLTWFLQVYTSIFGLWALGYAFGWNGALKHLNPQMAIIIAVVLAIVAMIMIYPKSKRLTTITKA